MVQWVLSLFLFSLWITAGMLKCCRLTEDAGTYCILWLALFALASIAESVSHYYVFSSQTINTQHSFLKKQSGKCLNTVYSQFQ